ncbi:hypothetical protein OQA88_1041 [Cercophora sp. LCS_1]
MAATISRSTTSPSVSAMPTLVGSMEDGDPRTDDSQMDESLNELPKVKIVLLAKFNGTTIFLEKWKRCKFALHACEAHPGFRPSTADATPDGGPQPRPTPHGSPQHPTPVLRQSITITQNITTNPTRIPLDPSFSNTFHGDGEGLQIKQVEFNTIASSIGGLSTQTSLLHRHLSQTVYPLLQSSAALSPLELPPNNSTQGLASGLRAAYTAYGPSTLGHSLTYWNVYQQTKPN